MPERRIYVKPGITDEVSNQNKKLTFSIAIVLIFLLIISIIFGIRQKGINDVRGKYEAILSTAQKDVDEAISLASVSPERSRELFLSSEEKLREIDALNIKDPKVEDLRKKINDGRGAILGEFPVSPEMFLDLSLLSSGFKGDTLTLSGGNIFILDKSGRRVISVELSTKKSKVVVGPDTFDEAFDMASYEDRVFILSGDGIYEVGTGKNKVIDKTWDGDALIKAFAGNIYVLDKSGNTIYRYQGSGSGFGDRGTWLAATTQANFSDVGQWVIDGAVYTLSTDSKVLKFSLGSPQRFSLSGVIPEIGKIDAIFAGDDTQNVYVIDRAGKRIVVLDKSGNYKAQYISDSISEASNIVVSESSKKILMLVGDKLYGIDIKN